MSDHPKSWSRRLGLGAGLVTLLVCAGWLTYLYWLAPGLAYGYEQPLPFSHRLHVTDKQIDCRYCHPYVGRSLNAGLPPVETCLGCHEYIIPGHPEIRRLKAYRDQGVAIPWVRVFYNPDHVYFPHYRHIGKGVECAECHGAVAETDRLMNRTFQMGFCITCHKQRTASRECTACHQ